MPPGSRMPRGKDSAAAPRLISGPIRDQSGDAIQDQKADGTLWVGGNNLQRPANRRVQKLPSLVDEGGDQGWLVEPASSASQHGCLIWGAETRRWRLRAVCFGNEHRLVPSLVQRGSNPHAQLQASQSKHARCGAPPGVVVRLHSHRPVRDIVDAKAR